MQRTQLVKVRAVVRSVSPDWQEISNIQHVRPFARLYLTAGTASAWSATDANRPRRHRPPLQVPYHHHHLRRRPRRHHLHCHRLRHVHLSRLHPPLRHLLLVRRSSQETTSIPLVHDFAMRTRLAGTASFVNASRAPFVSASIVA